MNQALKERLDNLFNSNQGIYYDGSVIKPTGYVVCIHEFGRHQSENMAAIQRDCHEAGYHLQVLPLDEKENPFGDKLVITKLNN